MCKCPPGPRNKSLGSVPIVDRKKNNSSVQEIAPSNPKALDNKKSSGSSNQENTDSITNYYKTKLQPNIISST